MCGGMTACVGRTDVGDGRVPTRLRSDLARFCRIPLAVAREGLDLATSGQDPSGFGGRVGRVVQPCVALRRAHRRGRGAGFDPSSLGSRPLVKKVRRPWPPDGFYPGYGGTRTFTDTVLRNSCTLDTFTVFGQKALTFTLPPPYGFGCSHPGAARARRTVRQSLFIRDFTGEMFPIEMSSRRIQVHADVQKRYTPLVSCTGRSAARAG